MYDIAAASDGGRGLVAEASGALPGALTLTS
jgi:hypothetical protein